MTREERNIKILQVFTYMVEEQLSLTQTAKHFKVDPGTLVKWKKKLIDLDQSLYHQIQSISNKNNSNKQVAEIKRRTYELAKVIIKYKFTLGQALIYCGYPISSNHLSKQLKQYLDEQTYQEVKVVLDAYNGTRTTPEQQEYFLKKLQEKQEQERRSKEEFECMPHVKQLRRIVNALLNKNQTLQSVAQKNKLTEEELILHIQELLPVIDYISYQELSLKIPLNFKETSVRIYEEKEKVR